MTICNRCHESPPYCNCKNPICNRCHESPPYCNCKNPQSSNAAPVGTQPVEITSSAWLDELEAALDNIRKLAKRVKKAKRADVWQYVDDAGDFIQEAINLGRASSSSVGVEPPKEAR